MLAGVATMPGIASAAIAGQQEAWGEWGPEPTAEPGKLFDPTMLGVDPSDGSVYVADLSLATSELLIQKFSEGGTLEGSASLPRISGEGFIGIAVDHTRERFYVLQDVQGLDSRNEEQFVATKILAFSTKPDLSGKLAQVAELPVPPVGEEKTLFEPREIALDPSTGDLVVLAKDSAGHDVLQRIETSGAGHVGARYLETGSTLNTEVDIAVDTQGTTYVLTDAPSLNPGNELTRAYTLSGDFATATLSPVPGFAAAAASEEWPNEEDFSASPVFVGQGLGFGAQVAIATSPDGERTLYWKAVERESSGAEAGEYVVHGYSLADEATSNAFGKGAGEGSCKVQTKFAALAAGSNGSLVVLDQGQLIGPGSLPEWFPVVFRFGPGGSGCPAPAAAIKLTEGNPGPEVTGPVAAPASITLDGSGSELNGKTLSEMTWKIEGESGAPVIAHGEKATHVFNEAGTYTIRLNMKTSRFLPIGTNFAAAAKKLVVTAAGKHTLGVNLSGTGEVKCEVNGGGEETCASEYNDGTELTLVPKPGAHFAFSGWSGGTGSAAACAGTGSCTFTLAAGSAVDAPFAAIERTLAISGAGSGSGRVKCEVNGGPAVDDPCAAEYADGTQLKLIPVATSGSEFVGFENGTGPAAGCTGGTPCTVTLEGGNAALDARFDPIAGQVALELHLTGTGTGEVKCDGGACAATYPEGTVVTLTAAPGAHSQLSGWTVAGSGSVTTPCAGTASPCEVKLQAPGPVSATADFAAKKHTLGLNLSGTGEVKCKVGGGAETACAAEYDEGTELTLVPKPGVNFAFSGWSGGTGSAAGCAGTGGCTFMMEANSTVSAPFAPVGRTLVINKAGTGSGTVTCNGVACAANYPSGTSIAIVANPASGSTFSGWSGGTGSAAACAGTGGCTITLNANSTLTAGFAPAQSGGGGGSGGGGTGVTPPPGGGGSSGGGTGGSGTTGGGKTPAQVLAEKRAKARAKCKKLHSKARAKCMRRANQIGKPKKKAAKTARSAASRPFELSGWAVSIWS
jgi:hypothetical protein